MDLASVCGNKYEAQKPTCGKELKHDILILSLANLELGFVQAMNPFYYTVICNQKYHLYTLD